MRRYIIEDVMFLDPSDRITMVISTLAEGVSFWEGISTQQQFDLPLLKIGDGDYYQIPSIVRSNNRKMSLLVDSTTTILCYIRWLGRVVQVSKSISCLETIDYLVVAISNKYSQFI